MWKVKNLIQGLTVSILIMSLFPISSFAAINNQLGNPVYNAPVQNSNYTYQCGYSESQSMYRSCDRRYTNTDFDAKPSEGRITKWNGEIQQVVDINNDEYRFAIDFMLKEGYLTIYRGKYFFPRGNISREDFIGILFKVLDIKVPDSTSERCYGDMNVRVKNRKEICYAREKGWLASNRAFHPKKAINHAAAAKILMSAYATPSMYSNLNDHYYDDVHASTWFARYVNAGRKHNIFPDKRRFDPGLSLTRREIALWFYNLSISDRAPVPEDTEILDIKEYTESKFGQLINESRAKYGKAALKYDLKLYNLALEHSEYMSRKSTLTHGNLKHYMYSLDNTYIGIGENIGMYTVTQDSISKMVNQLHTNMMNEPENEPNHRANILGESMAFNRYAVAVYEDKKSGRLWITQIFAVKR